MAQETSRRGQDDDGAVRAPRLESGRRLLLGWLGLCVAGLLACSADSKAPRVLPVGSVGPRPPDVASTSLEVAYAGPRGQAALGSSIQLSFNQAMRALDAATHSPPPSIELSPAVAGEWQWLGARALSFFPAAGRLPAATSFRVSVPAGTVALGGSALSSPYVFEFETPVPQVLDARPEPAAAGIEPSASIALHFNQPVAISAIERWGQLSATRAGKRQVLAFTVRARSDTPAQLEIVPRRPLPLASHIELRLAAGLTGSEGPRPLDTEYALGFDTYGPLRVAGIRCNLFPGTALCDPDGSLWIELSNPARVRELRDHLSIEPALGLRWSDDLDEESRYFYLPLRDSLGARTAYRVTLSAGLRDRYGQLLANPLESTLSTGDFAPRARLPISGEIFPAPQAALELESRNASELVLSARRLDTEQLLDFFAVRYDRAQLEQWLGRPGANETQLPPLPQNLLQRQPVALGPIFGREPARGAAWLGWRFAGSALEGQLIQVTDLALTAKLSTSGSLVWVTRLSDGKSVAGASVELVGRAPKVSKRYQTDASGLVSIPASDFQPQLQDYGSEADTLIFARLAGDSSFRRIADFLPPWRIEPAMRLSVPEREYGLLFSDRGIYRPGDTIELSGILRREASAGNTLIAGRQVSVQLLDPFGEPSQKLSVMTTRFGTFSAHVRLPGSAALGRWQLLAEGFEDCALGVQVAEYRPAEFKVRVDAARPSPLPGHLEGELAHFGVQADYLFGSPMAGRQLRVTATRQRTQFSPPQANGYVTSDQAYREELPDSGLEAAVFSRSEATLSATGGYDLALPLALPGQIGPEQVRLDAEVTDLSRQTVAASSGVLVHPAQHYVAIAELDSPFQSAPSVLRPRVLALSPSGERVARRVKLELCRRRWTLAREQTEEGWRTLSSPVDETQASCELTTGAEPQSCELAVGEAGQFFVRASSEDALGHVARAALGFYALGPGRVSWADNDQRKLELVLDKPQYRVGDTARLLIKSPFPRAEALLTVERAGIYEHRRLTLEGPAPSVEIKIDERLRPNAFVSVHLLQGVMANAPAQPLEVTPEPGYRLGYAELVIDPEARRLGVEIRGQSAEYRPRQRVTLELRVTRAGGAPQPAELTVYAVDEGVLSLSGYAPPDPLATFTASRPLAVATLETRDALGRLLLPGPERDKGEAGGGGGGGLRSNFRTTAYFNPSVLADADGRAEVTFELPDNLTTYRLMAVAVSEDDRYGVGSVPLVVARPLSIRPALPRAVRVGDRFAAAAIVTQRSGARGAAKVSVEVSGATLLGPKEKQVELDEQGSSEVSFQLEAQTPGELRIRFDASVGENSDQVELTRRITTPLALEATAVYGRTDQVEAQRLADLRGLRQDVGSLDLELASTALVGLEAGLQALSEYPYACTEQLASRLLPLGPLRGLAERYGLALPDGARELEAQVGEILRRQRGDGGFGLWPSSTESQPWASAYALWVLWQAKQAGAQLPQRVVDQGVAYLRQWLGGPAQGNSQGTGSAAAEANASAAARLATAALMVDVLATFGQPDAEYLTRLFEQREKLPTFARALLLHAAVTQGASGPPADAALLARSREELEGLVTLRGAKAQVQDAPADEFAELFHSEGRSEALVLWALLAADAAHPLAAPLAQGILDRRDGGQWQSTQEGAYALLALDAYRRAQETAEPHFDASVWLGPRRLLETAFSGPRARAVSQQLPLATLGTEPADLIFQKQGKGTLFYAARLRYATQQLPRDPLERGLSIQKSQRSVPVAALADALSRTVDLAASSQSFAGGDLVLVDLIVAAPSLRHFVAIEDPLPAGLEAVDTQLATSSSDLNLEAQAAAASAGPPGAGLPGAGLPGAGHNRFASSWYRQELRDDRVLFFVDHMPAGIYHYRYLARATSLGHFVAPPTRAFEMYQPEVFARTGASVVEVR